jgi:hypothetical protein
MTNQHAEAAESGSSILRRTLQAAIAEAAAVDVKLTLKDLTVLAPQNDPFRVDTPARHRDGEWLAITARELGLGDRVIHLRGLHYMVLGWPKPDGSPYINDDEHWEWLQGDCAKAARFLGYLPFGQIFDRRASAPVVQEYTRAEPKPFLNVGIEVEIPDADDILPKLGVDGFQGVQPYHLVMFAEKSSLDPILSPLAQEYGADLYLATGEISDSHLHRMAVSAVNDTRPMVVLCFSDADPSGWQMPVSIARKLQAFKTLLPAMPDFEVRRVALTPSMVRQYGLPSTPLKETEKRADKWRAATGTEQTEIDALAALQPELMREIALDAITPFYDHGLDRRVDEARRAWFSEALDLINRQLDGERLFGIREQATRRLGEMQRQIDELNGQLRIDVDDFDLPPIAIPVARTEGSTESPLIDSRLPFADQCQRLIDSKAYIGGER